jgi:hypothetical protein
LNPLQKGHFAIFFRRKWENVGERTSDNSDALPKMPKYGIEVGKNLLHFFES